MYIFVSHIVNANKVKIKSGEKIELINTAPGLFHHKDKISIISTRSELYLFIMNPISVSIKI